MSRYYDSKGSFRRSRGREEVDPMSSMSNVGDVMLVFACGLMLALVSYWNLDISAMTEVMEADQMAEVQDLEDMEDQLGDGGSSFMELGMVYQDPTTGKMYMMKEDIGEESAEGEQGAQDSGNAGSAQGAQGTGSAQRAQSARSAGSEEGQR